MQLVTALRYSPPDSIAFVGAGGKTTAIFRLARELLGKDCAEVTQKSVIVTTTTHFGAWQADQAGHALLINSPADIKHREDDFPDGVVLLHSGEKEGRLSGLPPETLDEVRLLAEKRQIPLLIEADGAHGCPLKAPDEHEPAIPDFVKQAVVVAGVQGLGKPLTQEWVHRPLKFMEISGLQAGERITVDAVAKVLLSPQGGRKAIPLESSKTVLLNQADKPELIALARSMAQQLMPAYRAVIIAGRKDLVGRVREETKQGMEADHTIHAVVEPVAGIILAAGGSSRFGGAKQLLPWRGEPLIRHVVKAALIGRLSPVVVVLGSRADEVGIAIKDLPLRIVINYNWKEGISSSIKAGLNALPDNTGGVVFLQADQPQCPPRLIQELCEAHTTNLSSITAPRVGAKRGNPVLFDRRTFNDLLSLSGDSGGRALFEKHPVQWVSWEDKNNFIDIDTPEDYRNFLKIYPEER